MKVPDTMTNTLQPTIKHHLNVLSFLPLVQLSNSQKQPYGWKHMSVPRRAPMRDTRPPKTGIALAMMYAIMVTLPVHANQVAQCTIPLELRCLVPRNKRINMYLAGI